ncbi:hypothetical protein EC957_010903 [Mortierella hygrophila]|uniref:F-box domain-containing protein n=1 Tax=Mortierella hygrophila TaxID=979708 RepID=A0A9P6F9X7_9FUNG|nr:hypothetical protein EC957_010903 [Mortierella hygrophila]
MLLLRPPFTTATDSSVSKLISVCLCPQSIYTTTEEIKGNGIVTPPVPSSLNYFAHIHHLNLDVGAMDPLQPVSQENWRSEQMYFLSAEFSQLRRSHHLARTYSNSLYHQRELVNMPRQVLLYREVTWLFANPVLEQLQSLTIPLSDIKRYTNIVCMMKSLEHIRYLLDEIWTHPVIRNSDGAEEKDVRMEEILSLAVQLVKDHVRLFPRRLRMVSSCNWDKRTEHSRQMIPEDVQLEIFRMLPPVQRMESLTGDNWMRVAAHPEATDLQFVETLLNNTPAEQWFGTSYDYRQLLQRCRTLKNLDIPPLGQGSFAWAVQEKRDHEGRIITNKGQGLAAWEEDLLPYGLVPLENFTIKEQLKPLTDEVDDVAFAFSQTLATITVTTLGTDTEMRRIQLGRGWVDLPMLTQLEIQSNFARLDLHPELLSHCPNVTSVKLSDRTYGYQCQDIVPCQAAHLAHVETLALTGWSALTFHQATLHSAKRLTTLAVTLELDSEDGCFIPPPSELKWSYGIEDDNRVGTEFQEPPAILRPQWTWDWYLPCLTDLYLTSEFAYCIQFQFLIGCPSLRSLALDMHSVDNDCLIMIPEDLVAPSIWGDPTSPPARIVVPSLRFLSLRGRWIMDDAYMLDIMTGMFPNLEDWVLDGWEDITLRGLIAVLRTQQPTSHYKTVFTSLALPSEQEEEEFGVLRKTRITGHEVLLPVTVYFYDIPYGEIHTVYRLTTGV